MQRPVLTMSLTVQPDVIRNICRNKTFRGRGLLDRFLYAIPKSNIGTRNFAEAPMSEVIALNYRNALKSILNQADCFEDGIKIRYTLKMTHEAYEKWLAYAKTVETLMREEIRHLSHITDWAGKLPGAIG
jgi:putative DNA primase/helicase